MMTASPALHHAPLYVYTASLAAESSSIERRKLRAHTNAHGFRSTRVTFVSCLTVVYHSLQLDVWQQALLWGALWHGAPLMSTGHGHV